MDTWLLAIEFGHRDYVSCGQFPEKLVYCLYFMGEETEAQGDNVT